MRCLAQWMLTNLDRASSIRPSSHRSHTDPSDFFLVFLEVNDESSHSEAPDPRLVCAPLASGAHRTAGMPAKNIRFRQLKFSCAIDLLACKNKEIHSIRSASHFFQNGTKSGIQQKNHGNYQGASIDDFFSIEILHIFHFFFGSFAFAF